MTRCLFLLLAVLVADAAAQGTACSPNYLLVGSDTGPAMTATSASFRLVGGTGSGMVLARGTSTAYVLTGGYPAVIGTPVAGRPWAVAVSPLTTPLGGRTVHSIHGVELDQGTLPAVRVGGVAATVATRTNTRIDVTLGTQAEPGRLDVEVTNPTAGTVLPRGLGVLPLLEVERPFDDTGSYGSEIVYRGRLGDVVVWMLAAGSGPRLPVGGFGWFFELDPFALVVLPGPAAGTDGVARLPIPATPFTRPVTAQALAVTFQGPYNPGAFTNLVQL